MLKRRKFPRVSERWRLVHHVINSGQFEESQVASLALNISGDGICFTSREPVDAGTMVILEMKSPDFDSPIVALAKVVWCKNRANGGSHDLGAEFWWMGWKDSDAQPAITEYLRKKASEESETNAFKSKIGRPQTN